MARPFVDFEQTFVKREVTAFHIFEKKTLSVGNCECLWVVAFSTRSKGTFLFHF